MSISLINSLKTCEISFVPREVGNHPQNLKQAFSSIPSFTSQDHSLEELCRLKNNVQFIRNNLHEIPQQKLFSIPRLITRYFRFLENIYIRINRFSIAKKLEHTVNKIKTAIRSRIKNLHTLSAFKDVYGAFNFNITPFLSAKQIESATKIYLKASHDFDAYYAANQTLKDDEIKYFKAEQEFLKGFDITIIDLFQTAFTSKTSPIDKLKYLKATLRILSTSIGEKVKFEDGRKTLRATNAEDDIFLLATLILKSRCFDLFKEISALRVDEIDWSIIDNDDERGQLNHISQSIQIAVGYIFSNPYESKES